MNYNAYQPIIQYITHFSNTLPLTTFVSSRLSAITEPFRKGPARKPTVRESVRGSVEGGGTAQWIVCVQLLPHPPAPHARN